MMDLFLRQGINPALIYKTYSLLNRWVSKRHLSGFFWIGFLNSRFSKTRAILTTYCKLALANQSYTFRQAEQQKQTK